MFDIDNHETEILAAGYNKKKQLKLKTSGTNKYFRHAIYVRD